ncbi:TPA: hypothetical protein ACTUT5_002057 [Legionella anisa]|uniref:hypothetical protein n=1 Tax=Legionella anisa TaxID=28082 RepID=UPI00034AD61A|nr:hypothetical protein [Legionella anisa]MCW8424107.1 hypothetical protein [Legionella anisa]MCW8447630.1 hypothetical protein [Legionella anisa]
MWLNRIKNQGKSGAIAPVEILYETTLQEGQDKVDLKNGSAIISTNGQEKSVNFHHFSRGRWRHPPLWS